MARTEARATRSLTHLRARDAGEICVCDVLRNYERAKLAMQRPCATTTLESSSFLRPMSANGFVRINVHYTTGTIATCTTHSTKATTHMLRRPCSYDEIWKRGWLPGESARMGRLGHRPVPPEWSILCAMCAVGKRKQAHIAHRLACVIRDPDA